MQFPYYGVKSIQEVGWVSQGAGWVSQGVGWVSQAWYLKRVKSFWVGIALCEIHGRGGYLKGWDGYLK